MSTSASADGLGGVQRPASGKHRQSLQQQLVTSQQKVIAPVDCRSKGLVPGQGRPSPVSQQLIPVVKPSGNLFDAQRAHASGR